MGITKFFRRKMLEWELGSPDISTRCDTVEKLGRLEDPKTIPILMGAMKDKSGDVREAAEKALAGIGKHALPILVERLENGNTKDRFNAISVLGNLKEPEAAVPLIHALKDRKGVVRGRAMNALLRLAKEVDVDLQEIASVLREHGKDDESRGWSVRTYKKIASIAARKRRQDVPVGLMPARMNPPKKKGMYRKRRVANG